MQTKTYTEKLQDPRWQKKRLEVFNRDNWTCRCCGDTTTQLEIHHVEYFEGLMPWEYPDDMLKTLCNACHKKEQERPKHEQYLIQALLSKGFLAGEILAMACMVDNDKWFRQFLFKITRQFANR